MIQKAVYPSAGRWAPRNFEQSSSPENVFKNKQSINLNKGEWQTKQNVMVKIIKLNWQI